MAFFNSAVGVLQTLVIALGAGLGIWGVINLLEGYGNDNPGAKSQGMWCCLCVKLQPCEILPGLPEAYHPETGCRAYAEKTRPYYAIEGKTAHFTRRSGHLSCIGKGLTPTPVKMRFYCVTHTIKTAPMKRRGTVAIH